MAIVALPALATAMLGRRFDEVRSLSDLELASLRAHVPPPDHAFVSMVRVVLREFKELPRGEVWSWAIGCLGPLDEARQENDQRWQWVIMEQIRAAALLMQKEGRGF